MNRKLLVIAIVPLVVGLSGAFAFSIFGSFTPNNISVTAGTANVIEQPYVVGGYYPGNTLCANWHVGGDVTPVPSTGSSGTGTISSPFVSTRAGGEFSILSAGSSGFGSYSLGVQNLAPGNWVEATFFLTNTGNIPATVFVAPHAPGFLELPLSSSFSGPLTHPGPAFQYMLEGPTAPWWITPSGASYTLQAHGANTIELELWIGLSLWAPNSMMGQTGTVTINLAVIA
jgi:hypothetical protein